MKKWIASLALTLLFVAMPQVAMAWKMEVRQISTQDTYDLATFDTINFDVPFDTPPVVFALPTSEGGNSANLRIKNVSTSGFEITITEPSEWDGPHINMTFAYLAIEPGVHQLPDGTLIEAGTLDTTTEQVGANFMTMGAWDSLTFSAAFASPPALLTQVQTMANEAGNPPGGTSQPFLTVATSAVTASGASIALERSENTTGTVAVNETIGYVAFSSGVASNLFDSTGTSVLYETVGSSAGISRWSNGCTTVNFTNTFPSPARTFASKVTRTDSDGGWLRTCGIPTSSAARLTIDEDIFFDSERSGTAEPASLVAFGSDFSSEFELPGDVDILQDQLEVGDTLDLSVEDTDLRGLGLMTLDVLVTNTDTMDTVMVTLTEVSPGVFEGTIPTAGVTGGGALGVNVADIIQLTYADTAPVTNLDDTAVVIGCGDGIVNLAEACDDGGTAALDGCDASCAIESGYSCPLTGGVCVTVEISTPADASTVSTGTPTFTGSATNGEGVNIVVVNSGGATVFDVTRSATGGTWSYTPVSSLSDGAYTVSASVASTGGAITDIHDFVVDTTAPTIAITDPPTTGTTTGVSTPSISGTAEVGSDVTVTVKDSGGATVSTGSFANSTGTWSLSPTLADGFYTIEAVATDAVGNSDSTTSDLTVDTNLPTVAITTPAAAGTSTQDLSPSISGTAEAGTDVVVSLIDSAGTTVYSQTFSSTSGAWSLGTPALAEGTYTISATATDSGGNASTDTSDIRVDVTAPVVDITDPAAVGTPTADTTPTIEGTTEAGATLVVTVRDASGVIVHTETISNAPASWSSTVASALSDGTYTVSATATDSAGNSATAFSGFRVDTTAPAVAITQPASAGTSTADNTPTLRGTAEIGSDVDLIVRDSGGNIIFTDAITGHSGSWSVTIPSALADGTYTISATATDEVGNTATANSDVTIDTTGPTVAIDSPADGAVLADSTPTFAGTVGADTTSATLELYNQSGALILSVPLNLSMGSWSYTPAVGLPDGSIRAVVTGRDALNNTSTDEHTFTIDTSTSLIVLAPIANAILTDNEPDASGTGEAGASVEVRIFDSSNTLVVFETAIVQVDSSWLADLGVVLPDGVYTLAATATDGVGNTASVNQGFTVDTTSSVAIDAPTNGSTIADTTPAIQGTAEASASVVVTVTDSMGAVVYTATVTATGDTWQTTPPSALPQNDGLTITAVATDGVGNTASDSITFTIDADAPILTIDAPTSGEAVADATPTISGKADPMASITLTINGDTITVTADGAGDWSYTPGADLADGPVDVEATTTNAAGTTSDASVSFVIDTVAPAVMVDVFPNSGVTNDQRLPVSGSAEPGSTVTVTLPDGTMVTVTADPAGRWTYTPTTDWAEGIVNLTVTATDAAGNTSPDAIASFEVDITPPGIVLDEPADGLVTADRQPDFAGSTEPDTQVTIQVTDSMGNVVFEQTVTSDATGAWSYTPLFQLPDNAYTVTATATDRAGNTADDTANFDVDTVDPLVSITSPADNSATNEVTPEIRGEAEAGASVEVTITDENGVIISTQMLTADVNGEWSYTPGSALTEGRYTIDAVATDAAGNQSMEEAAFEVDLTDPTITIDAPADMSVTSNTQPGISGVTEGGLSVELTISDSTGAVIETVTVTANATSGVWSHTPSMALVDGDYTLAASVEDAAGNTGSTMSTFTVDTTAPAIAIIEPINGSSTNDQSLSVAGTSDPGADVTIEVVDANGATVLISTVTAGADGTWATDLAALLPEGTYTVSATADDGLGNTATEAVTVTVDTTAPVIAIIAPADQSLTNNTLPDVSGTTEPGAVVVIEIRDSAGMIIVSEQVTADAAGDWSITLVDPLADDVYTVTATASDDAGNSADSEHEVTIDATAPGITIDDPADGLVTDMRDIMISGTTEPDTQIVVELADASGDIVDTITTTSDAMGGYSVAPSMPLADGDYTISATATDEAGNTSTQTSAFTVDSQDPQLMIVSPEDGSLSNNARPVISGTSDPGNTITVVIDGGDPVVVVADEMGEWSVELDADLGDGEHTIEVTATGQNGRETTAMIDLEIDTTAPTSTIDAPGEGSVNPDNTPTIEGTTEPGSTVVITIDGVEVAVIIADEDGKWSYTVPDDQMLAEGEHTIVATVTDPAGNGPIESAPRVIEIDTTAPALTLLTPEAGEVFEELPVTISGTTEPGLTVEVYVDGEKVADVVADENGDWSYETVEGDVDPDVEAHTVEARTTDASGQTSTTGEVGFNIAQPEPLVVEITSPSSGEEVDTATPTISGTATPGAEVVITIDGEEVATVIADDDGNWSYELGDADTLEDGPHTISATVTDGDESVSTPEIEFDVKTEEIIEPEDEFDSYILTGGCTTSPGRSPRLPIELLSIAGLVALARRRRRA